MYNISMEWDYRKPADTVESGVAELDALAERIRAELSSGGMIPPGSLVLAAVSGGADSVALLRILLLLRDILRFRLECVHVEHGIRAEDSLEDARFVEALCERLGILCHIVHADAPAAARLYGTGIEDAARRVRYGVFERIAAEREASRVALAHHKKDQAETLLLHLARGAGLAGLAGMRRTRGMYIRPLLAEYPETLRAFLLSIDQPWREDATNSDPNQPRAMIRAQVLPVLERVNPRAVDAIARAATIAAQEADLLDRLTDGWLDRHFRTTPYGGFLYDMEDIPLDDDGFRGRAIYRLALRLGMQAPEYAAVKKLAMRIGRHERFTANLPGGWRLEATARRAHLISPNSATVFLDFSKGVNGLPIEIINAGNTLGDGIKTQAMDRSILERCEWRTRKPGDWIQPFGMSGRRLLSDLFTDRKIDRPFRDYVPLAVIGSEVLWAVGVAASERLRVSADAPNPPTLRWLSPPIWDV